MPAVQGAQRPSLTLVLARGDPPQVDGLGPTGPVKMLIWNCGVHGNIADAANHPDDHDLDFGLASSSSFSMGGLDGDRGASLLLSLASASASGSAI